MSTILVSLDLSSTCTGYAKYINGELNTHGTFDFSKSKPSVRPKNMKKSIINYLLLTKPQIVVVESHPNKRNIKEQKMLSELNGIIEGFCMLNYAEFVTQAPNTSNEIGRGAQKVNIIFDGIDVLNNNEANAILIGYFRIKKFAKEENYDYKRFF